MPHIAVKHWPRAFTDAEKADLVDALTRTVTTTFGCPAGSVSIAVESVEQRHWTERVHVPELEERAHLLWKRPQYTQPVPTEGTGTR
ncbi:tautomerase family protein [Streptomyces coelicoflavus]|uniref:tautomerase family protein n=1 Tax=Streptomyces coelicoflavus TaxID=285562 RepID=UPI002E26D3F1|nr:tautomerase family protein [Streptomyces coelicoflavus]